MKEYIINEFRFKERTFKVKAENIDNLRKRLLAKEFKGGTMRVFTKLKDGTTAFLGKMEWDPIEGETLWYAFYSDDPYANIPSVINPKTGKLGRRL